MTGDVDRPSGSERASPIVPVEPGGKGGPAMSTVDVDVQKLKIPSVKPP